MQVTSKRRKFYTITVVVLAAIIGSAALIVVYVDDSYVRIEVSGTSKASFVVSYDSTSAPLTASENATVEVLPHVNVTITADPVAPYEVVSWQVSGATAVKVGQNSVDFLTGPSGSLVRVSAQLGTNSTD
jgi:hypothetical protein